MPDEPATTPGDVWVCGDHRIRCGESTNADDVAALLYRLTHHCDIVETGNESWRFKSRT